MIREKIYALGEFLVDRLRLDQMGKGKPELEQELLAVSGGSKTAVREYYVRKVLLVLAVLSGGLVLTLLCFFVCGRSSRISTFETLSRPGYGEDDRRTALSVQVDDEEALRDLEVTVRARKLTDAQKQQLLEEAVQQIDEEIAGENGSMDFVQSDLTFPKELEDGLVQISWSSQPSGVIDTDGQILKAEDEAGTLVEISAALACGDQECTYSCAAVVYPPDLTDEEQLLAAIRRKVEQADEENGYESELVLPGEVSGRRLTWVRVTQNPAGSILALTFLAAIALPIELDGRIHDKARKRKDQLLLDYPDLMWKMTMLLGAGMTLRNVFFRISEEYVRDQTRPRYVYDEVKRTCLEMQSGIGEAQAYERFGRRCQLPEYIRIGSILSQNLKKGAKGLAALLESEAEASLNDRKAHARQIGEQAGTKMLLPMGVMLVIVLAVLMVPAFLSF